jgi:hypothetical protein
MHYYCTKCDGLASFADAGGLAHHMATEHGCANCTDLYAALESIAEMDGKTLINDPGYSQDVKQAYSLGAALAFAQAAAIAKTCLPRRD